MFNSHRSLISCNQFKVDQDHRPTAGTMYVWCKDGSKEVYHFPVLTMAREQERAYRQQSRVRNVMVVS